MAPENIQTLTMEEFGISVGVGGGGGQRLRKFERGGGLDNKSQGNNFELSMKIATDLVDQF